MAHFGAYSSLSLHRLHNSSLSLCLLIEIFPSITVSCHHPPVTYCKHPSSFIHFIPLASLGIPQYLLHTYCASNIFLLFVVFLVFITWPAHLSLVNLMHFLISKSLNKVYSYWSCYLSNRNVHCS
jgi:hypothetical protein